MLEVVRTLVAEAKFKPDNWVFTFLYSFTCHWRILTHILMAETAKQWDRETTLSSYAYSIGTHRSHPGSLADHRTLESDLHILQWYIHTALPYTDQLCVWICEEVQSRWLNQGGLVITWPHRLITRPHKLITWLHRLITWPHKLITWSHRLITWPHKLITWSHRLITWPQKLITWSHRLIKWPYKLTYRSSPHRCHLRSHYLHHTPIPVWCIQPPHLDT